MSTLNFSIGILSWQGYDSLVNSLNSYQKNGLSLLTNKKFIKRFKFIESEANKLGKKINQLSVEEMNIFWQQAKSN